MCKGSRGSHVFLSQDANDPCLVCNDKNKVNAQKGMKVKCMKIYSNEETYLTPEYTWLVDGPPYNLNHIDIILVSNHMLMSCVNCIKKTEHQETKPDFWKCRECGLEAWRTSEEE